MAVRLGSDPISGCDLDFTDKPARGALAGEAQTPLGTNDSDLDAIEAESDGGDPWPPVEQPPQVFAQTHVMSRETVARQIEKLAVLEDAHSARGKGAAHRIHQPDRWFAVPQLRQREDIAIDRNQANPRRKLAPLEAAHHGVSDPVVRHQRVAEARDQEPGGLWPIRIGVRPVRGQVSIDPDAPSAPSTRYRGRTPVRSFRSSASTRCRKHRPIAVIGRPNSGGRVRCWRGSAPSV